MPYKSDSQRRFFHAAEKRGDMPHKTVAEFDNASKGKSLPEYVKKWAGGKMKRYADGGAVMPEPGTRAFFQPPQGFGEYSPPQYAIGGYVPNPDYHNPEPNFEDDVMEHSGARINGEAWDEPRDSQEDDELDGEDMGRTPRANFAHGGMAFAKALMRRRK